MAFFLKKSFLHSLIALSATGICVTTSLAADGSLEHPYTANDCLGINQACPAGIYVFDTTQTPSSIQQALNNIYLTASGHNADPQNIAVYDVNAEWSDNRYALLFKPGNYLINAKIGYYTQLLGVDPDRQKTTLSNLFVDNLCYDGNNPTSCLTLGALNNFWRGVENLSFAPPNCAIPGLSPRCIIWNVSQAAPMRNVQVHGDLMLALAGCFNKSGQTSNSSACGAGYASGGFLANSKIEGNIYSISQQQWFTRNTTFNSWNGGVWNMVFLNTTGNLPSFSPNTNPVGWPANENYTKDWPIFPITTQTNTSDFVTKEKPFLIFDQGFWKIRVPGAADLAFSDLVVMNKNHQDPLLINNELQNKAGLLIEPGVYQLDQALQIPAGKIVLGIGLPELAAHAGNAVLIANGENVRIAGVMIAAGKIQSSTLLSVDGGAANKNNATYLYDIFCRIGRKSTDPNDPGPSTKNCVTINSDNVVGDNLWLWRADHDLASNKNDRTDPRRNLVQWNQNKTEHGLLVNGNHVTMLGLFSEHHNAANVVWNGDDGRTYFYQSELDYLTPHQTQCPDSGIPGSCPAYLLTSKVHSHHAYGLGMYTFFQDPQTIAPAAIQAPLSDAILFEHLVGQSLNLSPSLNCLIQQYSGSSTAPNNIKCWGKATSTKTPLVAIGKFPY